jgi:hypothetical protein
MSYDNSTCIERQHLLIMEGQSNILLSFAFTLSCVGANFNMFGVQEGSQRSKVDSVQHQ